MNQCIYPLQLQTYTLRFKMMERINFKQIRQNEKQGTSYEMGLMLITHNLYIISLKKSL